MSFSAVTYAAVMAKKGKPNGIAPLDDEGKIDAHILVTVDNETLVFHKTGNESSE